MIQVSQHPLPGGGDPSSPETAPPIYQRQARPNESKKPRAPQPVRYYRRPLFALLFYLIFLLVPWGLIVVADRQTRSSPKNVIEDNSLNLYKRWYSAIPVLDIITALMTIPFISALLAHGAAVYSQRRNESKTLSLRQVISLANRDWVTLNPTLMHRWSGEASLYLFLATLFIVFVFIQLPLRYILLPMGVRSTFVCTSRGFNETLGKGKWTPHCDRIAWFYPDETTSPNGAVIISREVEPAQLATANANDIVRGIIQRLGNATVQEDQLHLWRAENGSDSRKLEIREGLDDFRSATMPFSEDYFWVSAVPSHATTGAIRQHALRLNSTSSCEPIDRADFPSSCAGQNPFEQEFSEHGLNIRICVPGPDHDGSDQFPRTNVSYPWAPHRDRQDLTERLFLDASVEEASFRMSALFIGDITGDEPRNMTIRCEARSTMGYFEVGNLHTENEPSELLNRWPSPDEMRELYHDFESKNLLTRESTSESFGPRPLNPTKGPLHMAAMALFGPDSYHSVLLDLFRASPEDNSTLPGALCRQIPRPLAGFNFPSPGNNTVEWFRAVSGVCDRPTMSRDILGESAYRFVEAFRYPNVADRAIGLAIFFANEVLLTYQRDSSGVYIRDARKIIDKRPTEFIGMKENPAGIRIISVLLGLQIILLLALMGYIYSLPTWTSTLDGLAMLRMGADSIVREVVPPLSIGSLITKAERKRLQTVDGLVGVKVERPTDPDAADGPTRAAAAAAITAEDEEANIEMSDLHRPSPSSRPPYTLAPTDSPAPSPGIASPAAQNDTFPPSPWQPENTTLLDDEPPTPDQGIRRTNSGTDLEPPPPYSGWTFHQRHRRPVAASTNRPAQTDPSQPRGPYELGVGEPGVLTRRMYKRFKRK